MVWGFFLFFLVPVSGSSPLLSVEDYQDRGIRVGCRASGWYPKPEMLWRDFQGRQLPSFTESSSQDPDGFFEVEKSIVIQRNAKQNVSCSVRNTRLPQQKDLTVSISGDLPTELKFWKSYPENEGFLPLILCTQWLLAASEEASGHGGGLLGTFSCAAPCITSVRWRRNRFLDRQGPCQGYSELGF